jgi:DNA polymerase I
VVGRHEQSAPISHDKPHAVDTILSDVPVDITSTPHTIKPMTDQTNDVPPNDSLCGVWYSPDGMLHSCWADAQGNRREQATPYIPQIWFAEEHPELKGVWTRLHGDGAMNWLYQPKHAEELDHALDVAKESKVPSLAIRPWEQFWLMETGYRLFDGLSFDAIRRCQLDIETRGTVGFPDPKIAGDRILAIGLRQGTQEHLLVLADDSDHAEKELLHQFQQVLLTLDPDVIEGHNIFRFDLNYLLERCKRFKIPCQWGRFGQKASFRRTRLRVAERWLDYPRCDIPGRTVFDTWLMIQLWDLGERNLLSYGLKEVAKELGITTHTDERTYLPGNQIDQAFQQDREAFLRYLSDDLRETAGLADFLLPTYVSQASILPMPLQEIALRGTAAKVDVLILQRYLQKGYALPEKSFVAPFEGGFSRSFTEGVFKKILHFDVASLYPSLLLSIDLNPQSDPLGVFLPLLKELRSMRLRFKQLAQNESDPILQREYQARQLSYKILINSFYGYLGFSEARFGDGALAANVTAAGRELLQSLIAEFERHGGQVLEADTDGLYLQSEEYFDQPEILLKKIESSLPDGIDLELSGRYEAMFCYKAKNYALYQNGKIIIRGSALRSRGMEPYLKDLTETLIAWLLGASEQNPAQQIEDMTRQILNQSIPIRKLCRSEFLSMSPLTYQKQVDGSKKPRRAAMEAALQQNPIPEMGDLVRYYIRTGEKARQPDWQRAVPMALFDPVARPYDSEHYLEKLHQWKIRYADFIAGYQQGSLF